MVYVVAVVIATGGFCQVPQVLVFLLPLSFAGILLLVWAWDLGLLLFFASFDSIWSCGAFAISLSLTVYCVEDGTFTSTPAEAAA